MIELATIKNVMLVTVMMKKGDETTTTKKVMMVHVPSSGRGEGLS